MRTTVEFPDELLVKVKVHAAGDGISLREFFIRAVEEKLAPQRVKTRRIPPSVKGPAGKRIGILSPEQIDEAVFG